MTRIMGTLVEVAAQGVLLRGPAGCGKSDTALALIAAGHRLVADDAVELHHADGQLYGRAPALGRGLLTLRGPGAIDIIHHYGPRALANSARLALVVELVHRPRPAALEGDWDAAWLLGMPVPRLCLAPDRPLRDLIPLAVAEVPRRGQTAVRFAAAQRRLLTTHGEASACG